MAEYVTAQGYREKVESTVNVKLTATDVNVDSEHPEYEQYKEHLQLAKEAYFGDGGFLTGERLAQYSDREHPEKLAERQDNAYYVNVLKAVINVFSNAIFTAGIDRTEKTGDLNLGQLFRSEFGDRDQTLQHAVNMAKLMSVGLIGVDRPGGEIKNRKDQEENPPQVVIINPLYMPDWNLSGTRFKWLKLREVDPDGRGDWQNPKTPDEMRRIWTPNEWILYRGLVTPSGTRTEWVEEARGANPLEDQVPIIPFWADVMRDPGCLYASTESLQGARMCLRIYNAHSEQTELQRGCMYPLLLWPTHDGNPAVHEVGVTQTQFYHMDASKAPEFISPPTDTLSTYTETIQDLVQYLFQTFRLDAETGLKPSSVSATQRIYIGEEANKAIRALSRQGERMELAVSKMLAKMEGKNPDMLDDPAFFRIKWPENYDRTVLADNIVLRLINIAKLTFPSQTMNRERTKYVAHNLIPLADEKRNQVDEEIDASDGIISFDGNTTERLTTPMTQHSGLDAEARGKDNMMERTEG